MATLDVVDLENKKVGSVDLDDAVWAAAPRKYLLTELVHWHRAKRRAGTQSVQTKAEVAGRSARPYRQKGTGNARQGSLKNPHMRGGGVAFAPKPRDYEYNMPKAKRRAGMAVALSLKVKEGGIRVLKDFELSEPKTKSVEAVLGKLGATKALIVDGDNENLKRSLGNLAGSRYLHHAGINVYELLKYPSLIITESAAKAITARLIGEGES